jgi:hypothetical protein
MNWFLPGPLVFCTMGAMGAILKYKTADFYRHAIFCCSWLINHARRKKEGRRERGGG